MKIFLILLLLALSLLTVAAMIDSKPFVNRSACVGCEDCVSLCPTKAISIKDGRAIIDADKCIECKFCVRACTYQAIKAPQ